MFERMTSAERIKLADARMQKVLENFLYLLKLNANNHFIVYTPTLSRQIRPSFAANAFNVFQRSMYQIEIVRLCALWDAVSNEKDDKEIRTGAGNEEPHPHSRCFRCRPS